jgi:broad specificity phosphatase PhoE
MKRIALLVLTIIALTVPVGISAQQTTVILVRHAEKVDGPGDVALTEAGNARAVRLTEFLKSAGITAVYSTPYKRTLETAGPIAKALGLEVLQTPANSTYAQSTAERVLKEQRGKTVLVVGHSNTTPDLAKALGVTVPAISDPEYDNLYVVQIAADGKATVIRAKY